MVVVGSEVCPYLAPFACFCCFLGHACLAHVLGRFSPVAALLLLFRMHMISYDNRLMLIVRLPRSLAPPVVD